MGNTERARAPAKMNSIVSITIATLALANAANLPSSNGTEPRINWLDVCDYFGAKCCDPGIEGHQYLVVTENIGWTDHALECQLFGGWLTVLETRQEWACIVDWVFEPGTVHRFAISARPDIPDYGQWAPGYPQGGDCVSMVMGSGVDPQGQWMDGDCSGDMMG